GVQLTADRRRLGPLVAALLPAQHGQVLHQHLLGRGEGMKRFDQTSKDLLEFLGVFARRQHEGQRWLGIEAVLEGVVSHLLFTLRGARPGGFLSVLTVRLGHPRRYFASFQRHFVSPCQNGKRGKWGGEGFLSEWEKGQTGKWGREDPLSPPFRHFPFS